jgi:LmbE family N-acetylglucosaminyl deacetylase
MKCGNIYDTPHVHLVCGGWRGHTGPHTCCCGCGFEWEFGTPATHSTEGGKERIARAAAKRLGVPPQWLDAQERDSDHRWQGPIDKLQNSE